MIEVKNLSKKYMISSKNQIPALDDVSFTLPNTGMYFITGKSGSGKSTLLNILCGFIDYNSGDIIIDGNPLSQLKEKQMAQYRNSYLGFIFQEYDLISLYTVGENIAISKQLQGEKATRDEIENLLNLLDLKDQDGKSLYDRKINDLSTGQKQRVSIARALIKNPKVIFADEPTGALDSENGKIILDILKQISKDRLVVIVTHDQQTADEYADGIIKLKDGKIESSSIRLINDESKYESIDFNKKNKGHLSFINILKFALSGFKVKKFRLILSSLLCFISTFIFGVSMVGYNVDLLSAELNEAYKNGVSDVLIKNYEKSSSVFTFDDGRPLIVQQFDEWDSNFTDKQEEILQSNKNMRKCYDLTSLIDQQQFGFGDLNINVDGKNYPSGYYGMQKFSTAIEIDPSDIDSTKDYKQDPRLTKTCSLPQSYDEIAITDYQADAFLNKGYRDVKDMSEVIEIKTVDDLIGKTIYGLKICGVYSTCEKKEKYLKDMNVDMFNIYQLNINQLSEKQKNYLALKNGTHMFNCLILKKGFVETFKYSNLIIDYIYKLSNNKFKDKSFLKKFNYTEKSKSKEGHQTSSYTNDYSIKIRSEVSGYGDKTSSYRDDQILNILLYFAIGFSIFTFLLFILFFTGSLDYRRKEFGIILAMGGKKTEIFKISLLQSILSAAIPFVITIISLLILCIDLNTRFNFGLYYISIIPLISIIALCFGVAALSTLISTHNVLSKKPMMVVNQSN